MGNLVSVCISKNKPFNPYPVVLYKIVGSPPPQLCKKIRVRHYRIGRWWHQVAIHAIKINGESGISKNKPFNPYYKIVGSPPPQLCKKIRVRHCHRIGRWWHQVAIHASGNPPTKINGKYSIWPILCKPQTPNPVILHQFVAAWPYYFLRKFQTFFPNPDFARVRYVPMLQKSPN